MEGQAGARGKGDGPAALMLLRPLSAPRPAPRLTSEDPGSEVELDDAPAEGCGHHAQGRQEASRQHDWPAAKAVHTHAAERACGTQH